MWILLKSLIIFSEQCSHSIFCKWIFVPKYQYWHWRQRRCFKKFILPFEVLIFDFWSFLWSKTSMRKSFSSTLVGPLWRFQLLFIACFWRKELHSGRYLRNFKNTHCWKLQFAVHKFLIRNHIRDHFLEIFTWLGVRI